MYRRLRLALPLLLLLPLGCGKKEDFKLAKVTGKIMIDRGKGPEPLEGAQVTFTPEEKGPDGKELPRSSGETGTGGEYSLKLVETDPAKAKSPREGAVIGKHRVSVELIERGAGGVKHLTAEDYRGPKSKLTFDVPEGGSSDANFTVKPGK
jgi:hypothetical protein